MAKRFTDTELWDKEWFMALSPKLKCLVKFLRDKCNQAGIWKPNWILAEVYIGEKVNEQELLNITGQFFKLTTGEIYCAGFIEFQYGTLSKKCNPHIKIISILEKYTQKEDRVVIGYFKGISTLEDKEEEEEKDKEMEEGGAGGNKLFKLSDLENYFKTTQTWRDRLCIANRLNSSDLCSAFERFKHDQDAKEMAYKNRADAVGHFANWLKKQKTTKKDPASSPVKKLTQQETDKLKF